MFDNNSEKPQFKGLTRHLELKSVGRCSQCNQWVPLSNLGAVGHHVGEDGKECRGSGYSPSNFKYKLLSKQSAIDLAKFIKTLTVDYCFVSVGERGHSLACANGRNCTKDKLRLASALADYFLENNEEK